MLSFRNALALFSLFLLTQLSLAQTNGGASPLANVVLKTDTAQYALAKNAIFFNGETHLPFAYSREDQVVEVNVFPASFQRLQSIRLLESGDYDVVDSLHNFNDQFYRIKIRFKHLTRSQLVALNFVVQEVSRKQQIVEVKLFPFTQTTVRFYPENDELFIGEEKIFELVTNNLQNVRVTGEWTKGEDIDYRISEKDGRLRLHVLPNAYGRKTLQLRLPTIRPSLDAAGQPVYQLPLIEQAFTVKASRLRFLTIDKKEITLDDEARKQGVEIMLDNNPFLTLQRTYRLENQEDPGGALIAEIFTRNYVSNNRVLCWMRVYNYHRQTDGYLYIKEGDKAKFITNVSITPKMTINAVSILHEGGDWTPNLAVFPGETIDLKIEGEGLHKGTFQFDDDILNITSDSSVRSENVAVYKLKIPVNVRKRKLLIYSKGAPIGQALTVREYQRARPLEFVLVNWGEGSVPVTEINGPVLFAHTIRDVSFSFNRGLIDSDGKLYGKQYLDLEIKITNARNELVDLRTIDNIVICPNDNSPRYAFYTDKQCLPGELNLNNYINRKTYDLDDWAKIQITIRHNKDKHTDEGTSRRIDIIQKRLTKFDIDVSFPAGLLTKTIDPENKNTKFSDLSGISLAMVAQFSFFHPEKINKLRPYKIGAGFLAFNAFNFSQNASVNRDVGIVVLGSLYPVQREMKLSFPLFIGGGYYMNAQKFFYLVGPGIRLRL